MASTSLRTDPLLTALAATLGAVLLVPPGAPPPPRTPGAASFARGTLVSTPSGMTPIQEMQVGDTVHFWNFDEHRIATTTVKSISHRRSRPVVEVDFGNWRMTATPDHRLWSATRHQWVRTADLRRREVMGVAAWNWVWRFAPGYSTVSSVRARPTTDVYNVDLHSAENYLVGPDRVIVSDYLPAVTSNPETPPQPAKEARK